VPEFEKHWDRLRRRTGSSWRVDETYVRIRGRWFYLYRAVDEEGRTIDLLLRPDRGIAAAQAFFRKAVATNYGRGPRKITLDGHDPNRRALWLERRDALSWRHIQVRTNRYLNNIVEQDYGAIKRRCSAMNGFKSVPAATCAIAGIELAHWIRKGRFRLGRARGRRRHSTKSAWGRALSGTRMVSKRVPARPTVAPFSLRQQIRPTVTTVKNHEAICCVV
jgi:transposase-like protein